MSKNFLLIISLSLFSFLSAAQNTPFILNNLQETRRFIRENEFEKALANCNAILQQDSLNTEVLALQSQSYAGIKQIDMALQSISKAIAINAKPEYYEVRGKHYRALKKYPEAISDFSALIKVSPIPLNYYYRALVYQNTKQYNLALSDLNDALKINPDFYTSYYIMLDIAEETGNKALAKQVEKEFKSDINMQYQLYSKLADFYQSIGDIDEAIKFVQKQSPNQPNPYKLAELEGDRGRLDKQLEYRIMIGKVSKDKSASYVNIGLCYRQTGYYGRAFDFYQASLLYFKNNVFTQAAKGVLYYYQGQYEKAFPILDSAVNLHKRYVIGYLQRGCVHIQAGNYEQARKDFAAAARLDSTPVSSRGGERSTYREGIEIYLGSLNIKTGNYPEALLHLNEALKLKKTLRGPLLNARAYVHARLGNIDSASKDNARSFKEQQVAYYPFYNAERVINKDKPFLAVQLAAPIADANTLFERTYHAAKSTDVWIKVRIIGPEKFDAANFRILNNGKPLDPALIEKVNIAKAVFSIENQPVTEYSFTLKHSSKTVKLSFEYMDEKSQPVNVEPE